MRLPNHSYLHGIIGVGAAAAVDGAGIVWQLGHCRRFEILFEAATYY